MKKNYLRGWVKLNARFVNALIYPIQTGGDFEAPLAKKFNNFKTNKFSDVTHNDVILRHCVDQVIQR